MAGPEAAAAAATAAAAAAAAAAAGSPAVQPSGPTASGGGGSGVKKKKKKKPRPPPPPPKHTKGTGAVAAAGGDGGGGAGGSGSPVAGARSPEATGNKTRRPPASPLPARGGAPRRAFDAPAEPVATVAAYSAGASCTSAPAKEITTTAVTALLPGETEGQVGRFATSLSDGTASPAPSRPGSMSSRPGSTSSRPGSNSSRPGSNCSRPGSSVTLSSSSSISQPSSTSSRPSSSQRQQQLADLRLFEQAVHENDTEAVWKLLRKGVDINARDADGFPFLTLAACYGFSPTVEVLLGAKAHVDVPASDGCTPLQVACQDGHEDVVQLLLEAGAEVNFHSPGTGVTALFLCCQEGQESSARMLLRAKADLEVRRQGFTPLFVAVQEQHARMAELLLGTGADPDGVAPQGGVSCLLMATQLGNLELVEQLLAARAAVDLAKNDGTTPLIAAAAQGRSDLTHALVVARADPQRVTTDGSTAVMLAAFKGDLRVVAQLVEAKADIDRQIASGDGDSDGTSARAIFLEAHGGNLEMHLDFHRPSLVRSSITATAVAAAPPSPGSPRGFLKKKPAVRRMGTDGDLRLGSPLSSVASGSPRPSAAGTRTPRSSTSATRTPRTPRASRGSRGSASGGGRPRPRSPAEADALALGSHLMLERDLEAGETIIKSKSGGTCAVM